MASTFLTFCTTTEKQTFENTQIKYQTGMSNMWNIAKAYWRDNREHATPAGEIPVMPLTAEMLLASSDDAIYRLGHSTLLLRLDGGFVLLDPVFSDRASPVQWMGPKRFHQVPIQIADLPPIKTVIISHDHYDHLDKAAVIELQDKVETFVMPLEVGKHLRKWGVAESKIVELDWWQSLQVDTLSITATPSQHFSGRGLFDRDQTLWASWVIKGTESNVYFSGDSGYFPGFKEIGEKYGPFDLTLMEAGAYNELWSDIHMLPEESVQAHIDLRGKVMLPIHNGTFDLALHNWFEPLEVIHELALQRGVALAAPVFGEQVKIKAPIVNRQWWQLALANRLATQM